MPGRLKLARRFCRYLPLILDAQVRGYVRDAVQGGNASGVSFKVKGDLMDMPGGRAAQEWPLVAVLNEALPARLTDNNHAVRPQEPAGDRRLSMGMKFAVTTTAVVVILESG